MNKTVLVTGTSQGLGLAFCKELISRGYKVIALDLKRSNELLALEGDMLQFVECDISDLESVKRAGKSADAETLDYIINNAGVWLEKRKPLDDADFEQEYDAMRKMFEVNSLGVLRIVREFMPRLLKGKSKKVLNVSSEAGSIGSCWRKSEYGYCMSKAAQNMATKIMSNAYKADGVKFYAVHPGWLISPMGFASATDVDVPGDKPEYSAKVFVDLLEGENKEGIYYDFHGNEMPW